MSGEGSFLFSKERFEQTMRRVGAGAGLVACLLNVIWLICMIALQSFGGVDMQAGEHPGLFRLSVGAALVLTLTQVPILTALSVATWRRAPVRSVLGGMFYALYIPINLIAYFSFGRMAPMVHAEPLSQDVIAMLVAGLVEIGHPMGVIGNLPILGYGLLGIAWCLLGSVLVRGSRLWKAASLLLFVSGFLSILGAVGSFINVEPLVFCCFLGGVVSFPAFILTAAAFKWGRS